MRDLLLRAQSFLEHLGHKIGLDDGSAHGRMYTPDSPELPDGMAELGRIEQLHLREPGNAAATALTFEPGELIAYLADDPTKPNRKTLMLVGRVERHVLDYCGVPRERRAEQPVLIGPLHRIVYHQGPPEAETRWEHAFGYEYGSDGSELPILFYDKPRERLIVLGGVYWVGVRTGIVN